MLAWTALGHLGVSRFAAPTDAAVVGIDRDVAAALACLAGALGLVLRPVRVPVAAMLMLSIAYGLSSAWFTGTMAVADLGRVMMALGALYLCWPQLVPAKVPDDQ